MKFGRSKREKLKRCCHVWIPKSVTQNICAATVGKQRQYHDDINSTTTVTNARDLLEGKIWFVGEPVNISTTSEFDWAEIGFKLSEEQIASYNLNDLVIYWYDEETSTLFPQATCVC